MRTTLVVSAPATSASTDRSTSAQATITTSPATCATISEISMRRTSSWRLSVNSLVELKPAKSAVVDTSGSSQASCASP
ncbi:MAG: hypothetical protein IPL19_08555 [Sandaracinaceae bacterium]|nr:hypothetical protein [Sandaracinaceae bacterium]